MIGFREGHAVCSEGIQDRVPSSFHSESLFHFEDHEHLKNDEEKISGESNYILLPLAYPWQWGGYLWLKWAFKAGINMAADQPNI